MIYNVRNILKFYKTISNILPKDLFNLVLTYCEVEYPLEETICFSYYNGYFKPISTFYNKIHNYDDFIFHWIDYNLNVKMLGIFIDFCYHQNREDCYKKMMDICRHYEYEGKRLDDVFRYQLLSKPYYWKKMEQYV